MNKKKITYFRKLRSFNGVNMSNKRSETSQIFGVFSSRLQAFIVK